MQTNVSQSNATSVQETKQLLKALIIASYPELRNVKVKDKWHFSIRAKWERRSIYVFSHNPRRAIIKFFDELN
jgi:hypothetical protein